MQHKAYHKLFGALNSTLSEYKSAGTILSFVTKQDRLGQFIELSLSAPTQTHLKRNQLADELHKKYKNIIASMMHPIEPHKQFCIYIKPCD